MSYDIRVQNKIRDEINKVLSFVKFGVINNGVAQKVKEQRLSQDIETYMKEQLKIAFVSNKSKLKYFKEIKENNGSTKAPYELLFLFIINKKQYDIYVDFKPINILKKNTAPYMGSINKYIERLATGNFYDVFMIVNYKSEVNTLPELTNVCLEFAKDITNFSLYNNWQLQLTIKNTKVIYGRNPTEFKEDLLVLLNKMKTETIQDIKNKCNRRIQMINKIKF